MSIAGLYPHKCGYCRQRSYVVMWMQCVTPIICLLMVSLAGGVGLFALKTRSAALHAGTTPVKRSAPTAQKTAMGKWASFQSSTVVDNQAILSMSQTHLSARTLVKVIERSPCRFDVSPKAMIRMKESGVSDEVIYAMLANLDQCDSEPAAPVLPAQIQDKVAASIATELVAPVQ